MEFKVGLGLEVGTCVNLKTLGYKINKSNEKGGWETDIRQLCKMSTTEKDELYTCTEPCPFLKANDREDLEISNKGHGL